jgi:DNA-binding response OmpR family regulator
VFKKRWNVLVVEDDPEVAKLLQLQLKSIKVRAEIARNGQEAILITGSRMPELIVMDLMLPHLDGIEASRYFKHKFPGYCVPILILTARNDAESRQECAGVGCDDFIEKPYDEADLFESVKRLMELGKNERKRDEMEAKRDSSADEKFDEAALARVVDRICQLRTAVAERLTERGHKELVLPHLERIERLSPGYASVASLRDKLS